MLKSLGRWIATNRVVGVIIIALAVVGAVGLVVALHLKWHEARSLISLDGHVRWHDFLIYAASLTAVIAALGGLLDCYKRRTVTLEAWWPKVRSGLLVASIPVWMSWIGILLEKNGSGVYSKWLNVLNNLSKPGRMILLVLAIGFVVWVVVFHVVVPAVKTFSTEGGGE